MQTDAEEMSSKPLPMHFDQLSQISTDPAPPHKELCRAFQDPVVCLLCVSPSRPLKPQLAVSWQQNCLSPHQLKQKAKGFQGSLLLSSFLSLRPTAGQAE